MGDLSEEQMEEMSATMRLPPEQRSTGQVGSLMDLVAGQQFFQSLSYKLAQQVCRHLRPLQVDAGDYVFREGEDGWEFYVLLRGTCDVVIRDQVVASMGVGTTFGELALIDGDGGNSKRTASIRCPNDCFLGVVGKDVYNRLIKKEQEAALSLVIDFYGRNQYLQEMRADTILHIAHVSQSKRWSKGDTIMATGEVVDGLLFLKSGQCMISKEVYLAPDSAICGTTAVSLSNSGHPGLRQDLKKISVDISLVCGYGDVVGESELLTEVLAEITAGKGKGKGAEENVDLTRLFTVTAVTDVEAFHVKPRDSKRFIQRSSAARQALVRNQARRENIFSQRMEQWESAREMQHGAKAGGDSAAASAAPGAAGGNGQRAVLAPMPENLARISAGAGGNVTRLHPGTMGSGSGVSQLPPASLPRMHPSDLGARARSTSPSHFQGSGGQHSLPRGAGPPRAQSSMMTSSDILRAKRPAAAPQRSNPLWAPKYTVAHPVDLMKRPTIAFGMQSRRFRMSADDKQKEREGASSGNHGGDLYDQMVWRANNITGLATQGRVSPALDSWFEEVAYIQSDGKLCA